MAGFRELYEGHFMFVWRSLRRLGVAERDCSDVAQEVFVVVHRRLSTLRQDVKPSTWMYGICVRAASDYRRRAANRYEVLDEAAVDSEGSRSPSASSVLAGREQVNELERILNAMPPEQREVFTAFELEGMSCPEIAISLEVPLGTVYSRLRLAREQIEKAAMRLQATSAFALRGLAHV